MNAHPRDFTPDERTRHFGERRTLPDALEMEQQLLGALLMRNELIDDLPVTFEAAHFEEPLHRKIFEAMQARAKDARSFNQVTIAPDLPDQDVGKMSLRQYLSAIAGEVVNFIDYPEWCNGITKAAARRAMVGIADDLAECAFDDELRLADDIEDVRRRLSDITQTLSSETAVFSITHALDRALDKASGR
ncbi:MAG: DnaB-like helicase N-terminal domain-containing protein, partial [Thermomicrobium sp.]